MGVLLHLPKTRMILNVNFQCQTFRLNAESWWACYVDVINIIKWISTEYLKWYNTCWLFHLFLMLIDLSPHSVCFIFGLHCTLPTHTQHSFSQTKTPWTGRKVESQDKRLSLQMLHLHSPFKIESSEIASFCFPSFGCVCTDTFPDMLQVLIMWHEAIMKQIQFIITVIIMPIII